LKIIIIICISVQIYMLRSYYSLIAAMRLKLYDLLCIFVSRSDHHCSVNNAL